MRMKNDFKKMKILVIKCPKCKAELFSRANHDFRWCNCTSPETKGGFVDGGHMEKNGIWSPMRVGGTLMGGEQRIIELEVTEKELYDDWNKNKDKYVF